MSSKEVIPALGLDSFSCPHCGALAQQHWFRVFARSFERGKKPLLRHLALLQEVDLRKMEDDKEKKAFKELTERLKKNQVTYQVVPYGEDCRWEMLNMHLSFCHSCDAWAVWIKDGLAWPLKDFGIEPHEDMPADVKVDFQEAAAIVDKSPRGAAALLRLALQKLMVDLGETGKNLNDDIASLVKKGLDSSIQRALDVVRVIGNNAVHPGEIDIKDDKATATALLNIVNLVVDRRISAQKRIDEMFQNLPAGARAAIAKRDKAE